MSGQSLVRPVIGCRRRCALAGLLILAALGCAPPEQATEPPSPLASGAATEPGSDPPRGLARPTRDQLALLGALFAATAEDHSELDLETTLARSDIIPPESPLSPLRTFLEGEALRARGRDAEARARFRRLAELGVRDPYGDGWGGCSLSIFGLWRWLEALEGDDTPSPEEIDAVLRTDRVLRTQSRLAMAVFHFGFLDSLPQLEEDLARRMALFAWRTGRAEQAKELFVDLLEVNRSAELAPEEAGILDSILEQGRVSRDRIEALRADRLIALRQYGPAIEILTALLDAGDAGDRARARIDLAGLQRRLYAADRVEISAHLDTALLEARDPDLVQRALRLRALTWRRAGPGQDLNRSIADLEELLDRFPDGSYADDALYDLGTHFLRVARLEPEQRPRSLARALDYFRRLRNFSGTNDWLNSAYFQPAMALYTEGGLESLREAIALFDELNERVPAGPLHRNSAFWKARALEELGQEALARAAFEALIDERPFDYHSLRANVHLRLGSQARQRLWPDADTRAALGELYRANPPYERMRGATAYHQRLWGMLESGLYRRVVELRQALRQRFPTRRLGTVPLGRLDEEGSIPFLALLLTARQDAVAAADSPPETRNQLEVLAAVAHDSEDWPLVTGMALGRHRPRPGRESIAADPRFLATAYPGVFVDLFRAASERRHVPAELLYGLSRRESLFDPSAVSVAAALGLFQFIPSVFEALDERWGLLSDSGASSADEFLLDPASSIDLGGRWLWDELLRRQNCVLLKELGRACNRENRSDSSAVVVPESAWFSADLPTPQQRAVLLALMEHSAGYANVKAWLADWQRLGRENDFEYMVETAGALETRILMRGTLLDTSIATATGLLERGTD